MKQQLFIILLLFVACNSIDDDLKGRNIYAGKVILIDSLGGVQKTIRTDSVITVKVYKDLQTINLFQSAKTFNKDNFTVDYFEAPRTYTLTAEIKLSGVNYKGSLEYTTKKDDRNYNLSIIKDTIKLVLYADVSGRNLLKIAVTDEGNAAVPRADGGLFTSRILFETYSNLNANYTQTGDEDGGVSFSNITPGRYYLFVSKALDTIPGAVVIKGADTIDIVNGQIKTVNLKLK